MITDENIKNAYLLQYEHGILKREVRSYEVSIWTLQDEFISVLKWSDVEQKGRILNPKMILSDDGTQEFSFDIPMYYYNERNLFVENPNWVNTHNGNLMINLRKLKVIFNKMTDDKEVFEFVITVITEKHEDDILTCSIKSEGLAFHELGKIGYLYVCSLDEFIEDYKKWHENGAISEMPKQNVQYWCLKIGLIPVPTYANANINPLQWMYEIKMNWRSYPFSNKRLNNIVYEEEYADAWNEDLIATHTLMFREKERTVEISLSNVYNITLEIAKQFEIRCKYEYLYDDNNHIIARKVVFYNTYINDDVAFSFTYPYSSTSVTRELDSTDLTTKMYVLGMEDESTLLGEANIEDCEANKILENYILNFDYLKETRGIMDELADFIDEFEKEIRQLNLLIRPLQLRLEVYSRQKTEVEAKITTYTNAVNLDMEQINLNSALAQELVSKYDNPDTEGVYLAGYTEGHPSQAVIITDDLGRYYINLKTLKKGIKLETLHLYHNYNVTQHLLSNEITSYHIERDDYDVPERIYGIAPTDESSRIYLTYEYDPKLYYEIIVATWTEKLGNDKQALEENKLILNGTGEINEEGESIPPYGLIPLIDLALEELDNLLAKKLTLIKRLELILGPALREGYWQPEDYLSYGESYIHTEPFPTTYSNEMIIDTGTDCIYKWDKELLDEELKIYYASGINEERKLYPCINISSIMPYIVNNLARYDNLFVMWNNNYVEPATSLEEAFSNIAHIRNFSIGANAVFGFVSSDYGTEVYPALILTGAKGLTDNELAYMRGPNSYISLGILTTNTVGSLVFVNVGNLLSISDDTFWTFGDINPWIQDLEGNYTLNHDIAYNLTTVFPRIKFSSMMLKTSEDNLFINYNNKLLVNYEDYYISTRIDKASYYLPECLITLKPEAMIKLLTLYNSTNPTLMINYVLSNASTAIYLDALKIAKENAYPKVTYTVTPNILLTDITRTLYKRLNWLVMINDALLKFKDVFGYISKIELDLDAPQNDKVEVKNYTDKFEDLFSTIVASTEAMQHNEGLLRALSSGTYMLAAAGLLSTLEKNDTAMVNYLAEHFLTSDAMLLYLSNIFLEVSNILSDSNHAIGETQTLTLANSKILSGFASLILNELVPTIYKQGNMPSTFKKGDIWIQIEWVPGEGSFAGYEREVARYVATSDYNNSMQGYGWTKTYGGTMAQVKGPGIDMDADTGTLDLFGDNVKIVGNKSVNIGSVEVNIGANSDLANPGYGGVNIVATGYNSENFNGAIASKVLIHPEEVYMYGSKINLLSGDPAAVNPAIGTSAIQLSGENGIWIGSGKGVTLFSGNNDVGDTSGANIELMPNHLLFGVTSSNGTTAMKLTSDAFVVAPGATAANNISDNTTALTGIGTTTGVLGFKITKDFMGMAVLDTSNNTNVLNAFILNKNGLTLGAGVSSSGNLTLTLGDADLSTADNGTYVRISGKGFIVKGGSILLISNANMLFDSGSIISLNALGSSLLLSGAYILLSGDNAILLVLTKNVVINSAATGNNSIFELNKLSGNTYETALKYTQNGGLSILKALTVGNTSSSSYMTYTPEGGLVIHGSIWTTSGLIGGWTIDLNSLRSGVVSLNSAGTYAINVNDTFMVDFDGHVWMKSLIIDNQSVDISDFNQAVAYGSGAWNGTTFNATFNFFKGKISRTVSISSSVDVTGISGVAPWAQGGADGYALGTVRLDLYVSGVKRSEAKEGIQFDASSLYSTAWNQARGIISYTAGAKIIRVPAIGGFAAKSTENYDISATYNAGWNAAAASENNCVGLTLLPGHGVSITVPANGGGTSTFYVYAASGSGGGSGGGCFIAGSSVKLANNKDLSIERLTVGKMVYGYDVENNSLVKTEIRAVLMFKNASNIVEIHTDNNKKIILTKNHTMLTEDGWRALDVEGAKLENPHLEIAQLTLNNKLVNEDGTYALIVDIIERTDLNGSAVYNIDVEPYDTYIVNGFVVHNAEVKPDMG